MSLYNMMFGENKDAKDLLKMLYLDPDDFGRFRDAYLNADGTKIIVYTRCGGGNREDYEPVFKTMRSHPNYILDSDDNYDETYCYFEFSVPSEFIEQTKAKATGVEPPTIEEKFNDFFKEMEDPNSEASKKSEKIAKKITEGMEENPDGGVILI